jgi:hypothetical protein
MDMQLVERIFGGEGLSCPFRAPVRLSLPFPSNTLENARTEMRKDEINGSSRKVFRGNDIQLILWAFSNFNEFNFFVPHRS